MAAAHFDTPRGSGHMRRLVIGVLLMVALATAVAGCWGSGKKPATDGTTLAAQTTPPAAAAQGQSTAAPETTSAAHTGTSPAGTRRGKKQAQVSSQTQTAKTHGQTIATSTTTSATTEGVRSTAPAATTPRHKSKPSGPHPASPASTTTTSTTPNWVDTTGSGETTTIPATSATPAYVGTSPIFCLETAGLNRARPATEPYVWEANSGGSSESDHIAEVFLSGPYQDDSTAQNYAQSLTSVELATSGGRWVASAAQTSGLQSQVNQVAACMAAG